VGRSRWIAIGGASLFLLVSAFLGMGSFSKLEAQTIVVDGSDTADELQPPSSPTPRALPAPTPGETLVYFVPTDNDATATVLYFVNTDSVAHTVALRGFSYNGVVVYSLNIDLPATSMRRLASDSIVSSPPPSWGSASDPNLPDPIITNFTDFTYFASLSLPKGVKVDGYTLFNPGTGVVDPRKDQGAMPLRFMPEPATLPWLAVTSLAALAWQRSAGSKRLRGSASKSSAGACGSSSVSNVTSEPAPVHAGFSSDTGGNRHGQV
jgi:hypothetical protein